MNPEPEIITISRRPSSPALAVFARSPIPGKSKTRLIPLLGGKRAAAFQKSLLEDTLLKVSQLKSQIDRYLFMAGGASILPVKVHGQEGHATGPKSPRGYNIHRQRGRDLSTRLSNAFSLLLRQHSRVLIIGTDSPLMPPRLLRVAIEELKWTDAVLGPCPDGGFYLIGLRWIERNLFEGIRMGSQFAFTDMLDRLLTTGLSCSVLPPVSDVDRPEDYLELKRKLEENAALRRRLPATSYFLRLVSP